ncbi:MAG: hypothetical protein EA397_11175 [Deltaproteobacteria bacterium]|nr:MAG: hypothetical protein EA397_11175 [Deltaproteobacteria bacterium]
MHSSLIKGACVALVVAGPTLAFAKKGKQEGIELVIAVVDAESEEPVRTAKVRNPQEKETQSVNTDTGEWRGRVLYLPDGTEVFFDRGMELTFEVSAPNYKLQKVVYTMRKRRNRIVVPLERMSLDLDDLDDDEPVIQFGRDRPIGGRPID